MRLGWFCRDFQRKFENLCKRKSENTAIFKCTERDLNLQYCLQKALAARDERSVLGYQKSNESVTILACLNASDNNLKLKIMVIGKSKELGTFKNVSIKSLPKNQIRVDFFQKMYLWICY